MENRKKKLEVTLIKNFCFFSIVIVIIFAIVAGPVKIYAQNCLQAPAERSQPAISRAFSLLWKNSNYTAFPCDATMKLYFRAK